MLEVNERLSIPLAEFHFTFSRSGGPGGQNVNKVNTKVQLRWAIHRSRYLPDDVRERFLQLHRRRINKQGEFYIGSERFRDQGRNVADCLNKLRVLLNEACQRPAKRKPVKPSRGAKIRRMQDKRARSQRKQLRKPPASD